VDDVIILNGIKNAERVLAGTLGKGANWFSR
jgi:hypothetical protein